MTASWDSPAHAVSFAPAYEYRKPCLPVESQLTDPTEGRQANAVVERVVRTDAR
jgi:hypothetical protein